MRYSTAARQRERAIAGLTDLADSGQRTVEIRQVLAWLGVGWGEPRPGNAPGTTIPGTDPLTGCAPVVAEP
jgi:hypothetical protein